MFHIILNKNSPPPPKKKPLQRASACKQGLPACIPSVFSYSAYWVGCCVFKLCVKAIVEKCLVIVPPFDTWHEQLLQTACLMFLVETVKSFHMADIFTVNLLLWLFKHISSDWTMRANSILITFLFLLLLKLFGRIWSDIWIVYLHDLQSKTFSTRNLKDAWWFNPYFYLLARRKRKVSCRH